MKTIDAIEHFGSKRKLAQALDVSTQAIYKWGEIIPALRAYQLQDITDGELEVEPGDYDKEDV